MPPVGYPINPGDIIEHILWQVYASQVLMNTFHYRYEGEVQIADGQTAMFHFNTWSLAAGGMRFKQRGIQVAALSHTQTTTQKIFPQRYAPEINATAENGLVVLPGAPQNVAASIERAPLEAGKGYPGRVQIGGVANELIVNGRINVPALPANWDVYRFQLQTAVTPFAGEGPYYPVLIKPNPFGPTTRYVQRTSIKDTIRTMHRRTVGLGI